MFKKSESKTNGESRPRPQATRSSSGESAISIIGPGMHIRGDLTTDGTVRVEGSIEGTIRAGKSVILGKEGRITGDVITQDAVIGGQLNGSIVAESRLELQATCVVDGEIRARAEHLKLEEGAQFNGAIQMDDGKAGGEKTSAAAAEVTVSQQISPELSTNR
ncbi:MAG: polymer-forming cytoskeletal protein [Gemmatimonadetes bacterium]|nr:polymer-forming cytoskeletal protein [Gemmatimonadota bacterium]